MRDISLGVVEALYLVEAWNKEAKARDNPKWGDPNHTSDYCSDSPYSAIIANADTKTELKNRVSAARRY